MKLKSTYNKAKISNGSSHTVPCETQTKSQAKQAKIIMLLIVRDNVMFVSDYLTPSHKCEKKKPCTLVAHMWHAAAGKR